MTPPCSFELKESARSTITLCYQKQLQLKRVLKIRKLPESNELSIAYRLSLLPHRNVARFFNGTEAGEGFKLSMQFYENGDLLEFQRGNKMSSRMIKRFLHDIVHGIAHLHSLGIAHRDIALENVLLDKKFRCHLSGFSLAVENGIECSRTINKAFYTAPEVLRRDGLNYNGFQSDLWSLGILILILVSRGNVPFVHASSTDQNFQRFLQLGVRNHITSRRLTVSEHCIDLMERLLQADPAQRPSIVQVMEHPFFTTSEIVNRPSPQVLPATKSGFFGSFFRSIRK